MIEKKAKKRNVKKYSYSRIAGNYIKLFSMPGKIIIFLIIIVLLLIMSIIFLKAVL
jgi:cell division protein FtsL